MRGGLAIVMNLQTAVLLLWLVLSGAVIVIFILAYRSSRTRPASTPYEVVNRRRFRIFFVLVAGFLALFLIAMMKAPYSTEGEADDIVGVRARMFSYELTKDTVDSGKLIEFRVTAEDVTHGFGVYGPEGSIIGQVQAMPGYVNRVRIRFAAPGRYDILCLEYCGPLHHQMRSSIIAR